MLTTGSRCKPLSTETSVCRTFGWTRRRWLIRPPSPKAGGNPQLAENFLRAAELATVDDEAVMNLYEALRPHRSTAAELEALRVSLEGRGASRCAELVRQAGVVYARRGLLR